MWSTRFPFKGSAWLKGIEWDERIHHFFNPRNVKRNEIKIQWRRKKERNQEKKAKCAKWRKRKGGGREREKSWGNTL